jgi:hypothetical protein
VPDSSRQLAPCFSATTRYIAKIIAAGELIVIDVVMSLRQMPSNSVSMSASDVMFTPHFPTSPSESSSSGSRPISVGRSKATLSPVPPASSSVLYRWFVSSGVPNPANCRMVQSLPRYPLG